MGGLWSPQAPLVIRRPGVPDPTGGRFRNPLGALVSRPVSTRSSCATLASLFGPGQEGCMAIDTAKIRNVGFVSHGGVGKTSLVEALLFSAGAINRLGRVEDGTTTTDYDADEIKRQITINIGVAYCDYKDHRINLVDMPGYGDFIAEARAGLRAVEGAVVVVDAVAGVEVQTEKVSKFAQEYGLP